MESEIADSIAAPEIADIEFDGAELGDSQEGGTQSTGSRDADRIKTAIKNSEYLIKFTAKTNFARLHLRNGCWRATDTRDSVAVFDIDEADYQAICHLCWPKGTQPLHNPEHKSKCLQKSIRAVAGVRQADTDESSSTTESSSSSPEPKNQA